MPFNNPGNVANFTSLFSNWTVGHKPSIIMYPMTKRLIITTAMFLSLAALTRHEATAQFGNIYKQDSLVKVLVKRHIALGQAQKSMPGYRVQIYFGPDRNDAIEIQEEFGSMFRDIPAYLSYQQPNFKIRAGDFPDRLMAQKFLQEIQTLYSSAFIVRDDVKLPKP